MDVAAWLHGLEMQQYEPRVSKQRDLTLLNLEHLGIKGKPCRRGE